MADDEPTLRWRVEAVERRLDGKLSRDVYEADQRGNDARHTRAEKDIAQQSERLRNFFWTGAGLFLALVVGNVVAKLMGF